MLSVIKSVLTASAIAFFTSANAHMILLTPPPYGSPDSSPLDSSGANFPCKGATSAAGGPVTNMPIGSKQTLTFKGSAVHGGGSCQVSLTTDNPATKASKWMVIHSIEGGCPARGQGGNEGSGASGGDKYDYTIPQGVTPGKYTLSWTWFNKIGNREMYMNCASVQISGGSSKRDSDLNETYAIPELSERATPNFPAMFVANIPATDCTTTDSQDLQFPDPGTSVEKAGSGTLAPPKGPKCAAAGSSSGGTQAAVAGGSSGSGTGSGAAPSASTSPSAATGASSGSGSAPDSQSAPAGGSSAMPSAASAPAASPSSAAAGGSSGSASTPDSQSAPAGGSAAMPSVAAPSAAAPSAASNSSGSSSGSTSDSSSGSTSGSSSGSGAVAAAPAAAGSSTGSCTQPGQSICSPDGKQIGTCTAGMTVTWIPVAAGTKCQGGLMVMAGSKRSAKFALVYNFPRLR